MKQVIKSALVAAALFSTVAHAWHYDTINTGNEKLGTMYVWSSAPADREHGLSLNCLSTGGAWIKLADGENGYQAPALADYPAITKIVVNDAEGVSTFSQDDLNLWSENGARRLAELTDALNYALAITVQTDDKQTYRIRPDQDHGKIDISKCVDGIPAMVDTATMTVKMP